MAATFATGQTVQIQCEASPGAFPGEFLVAFDSVEGRVSGFVKSENFRQSGPDAGYIFGTVTNVSDDTLTVMVRGSFFTTNGLAQLKRDWANAHVKEARVA